MSQEILVTVVGGGVELISVEEYLEVISEEGVGINLGNFEEETELGPCYPSCVGCELKQYCEVMGKCLA